MELKVGQRWLWDCPGYEYIVEVMPGGSKVVQIIGNSDSIPKLGAVIAIYFDIYSKWTYLEGQDKPRE